MHDANTEFRLLELPEFRVKETYLSARYEGDLVLGGNKVKNFLCKMGLDHVPAIFSWAHEVKEWREEKGWGWGGLKSHIDSM